MNVTLYDIASRFVGLKDVPGPTTNPAVLAMLRLDNEWPEDDSVAWCGAFLSYCAWLLRLPRSKSLMARSWLDVGAPISLDYAKKGFDVCVLWRGTKESASGHVGLFAGREPGGVLLLGGNQGSSVSIASFPTDRILGVRRLLEE